MRKWKLGGMLAALVIATAACNVVVTPTATNGWAFTKDGFTGGSSGVYMNGPGIPPAGRGSALLTIDNTGREAIASLGYNNVGIAALSQLQYSTYQVSANATGGSPNLEFDTDYDSTDSTSTYQGRLVYVPEASGTPDVPRTWQTWNTMTGSGAWYSSGSPILGNTAQPQTCTQASFCTWAQVIAAYPHAKIAGFLLLRVGGNAHEGSAAVDNLVVGVGSVAQFTNFEPGDGNIAVTTSSAAGLGFGFAQDSGTGTGSFVTGPNGSDNAESAQLKLNSAADGELLGTGVFAGTHFSDLTFLSYKTYQAAAGTNATTLQFDADYDSTDSSTAFQGRVVFEPSESAGATVTSETWQTWNPLTATSGWWQTGTPVLGDVGGNPKLCTQASPCSFQQLMTDYPNLAIRPITGQSGGNPVGGGIYLKAGSNWQVPFTGNVDSLTIGVKAGTTNGTVTYDLGG